MVLAHQYLGDANEETRKHMVITNYMPPVGSLGDNCHLNWGHTNSTSSFYHSFFSFFFSFPSLIYVILLIFLHSKPQPSKSQIKNQTNISKKVQCNSWCVMGPPRMLSARRTSAETVVSASRAVVLGHSSELRRLKKTQFCVTILMSVFFLHSQSNHKPKKRG